MILLEIPSNQTEISISVINLTILLVYTAAALVLLFGHWNQVSQKPSVLFGMAGTALAVLGFAIHSFANFNSIF